MPGRSNRASPRVRGWSRAIWSWVTTVTGENVLVATGRTPIGTAASAATAPRDGWIGLGLVTLISSRATACCARAAEGVRRPAQTVEDRTVLARKPKRREGSIETHTVLYRFIVAVPRSGASVNPAGVGHGRETLHRCNS